MGLLGDFEIRVVVFMGLLGNFESAIRAGKTREQAKGFVSEGRSPDGTSPEAPGGFFESSTPLPDGAKDSRIFSLDGKTPPDYGGRD